MRRSNQSDARTYFLADRRLPWPQVAGSLLLTNLSTEQLIGLNGAASIHGAVVMAWEVMAVFGLLALAWYFLPRYWSGNITTIPEFLEQRFDRATRRLLGTILLITLAGNVLPFVLYSGGLAISGMFGLPALLHCSPAQALFLATVGIGLVGGAYVIFGGMRAVAFSDTIYGVGVLAGAVLIPALALWRVGHGDWMNGLRAVRGDERLRFDPIGGPNSNVPFSTLVTGLLLINLFYWATNQVIVQRSFGARSFAEAQKGILATAGLKLLGPLYLVLPGIVAAHWFGGAVGNGDLAYARLVGAVLPEYLIGVFAAVLVGSVLSAFNGGLHSAATLFGLDIYRNWFRPGADDRSMLRAGKIFAAVVCVAAIAGSGLIGGAPEGVFTLMKRIMAAFNIPLLAVVAMGMLTKRVPAWAARAALVGGVVSYFVLLWALGDGRFGYSVHWLHLAAINAGLLCVGMALAGIWSAPVPVARLAPAGAATLSPWPHLRLATGLTLVGAAAIYALFCRLAAV